jgi:hypothetical protein
MAKVLPPALLQYGSSTVDPKFEGAWNQNTNKFAKPAQGSHIINGIHNVNLYGD